MYSEGALRQACVQAELLSEQLVERYRETAFRIVLERLLSGPPLLSDSGRSTPAVDKPAAAKASGRRKAGRVTEGEDTLGGRILSLKADSFFSVQRALSEIKKELAAKGFHYPITSMSGVLQTLTRQRELRREHVAEGKRKVWKYSNY